MQGKAMHVEEKSKVHPPHTHTLTLPITNTAIIRTPQENQILLPLTPPLSTDGLHSHSHTHSHSESPSSSPPQVVTTVLALIRQQQQGRAIGTDFPQQVRATPLEYHDLLAELEKEPQLKAFVDEKLRWEYNPLNTTLSLQPMPTVLHDHFADQLAETTVTQLKNIALTSDNTEHSTFAAQISTLGSGTLLLREHGLDSDREEIDSADIHITKQPDKSFHHPEAVYPGVVYEVAVTQGFKSLKRKAWTYIQSSGANIKRVVGFELGNRGGKEARVSMWKPLYITDEVGDDVLTVETVIDRKLFRSSDGSPANSTLSISLPLSAFATSEIATFPSDPSTPSITIPYTSLITYLQSAESHQRVIDPGKGEVPTGKLTKRPAKRKRLSTSSVEELSIEREGEFCSREEEVGEGEKGDGEFRERKIGSGDSRRSSRSGSKRRLSVGRMVSRSEPG
ncbi:uncharacterized protein RSE6_13404 [Rhynchosporium secalis]|uniref:Uncharacterized protein n=1 Tax=Rhynchosporium secalis TaxID=38038 RepID=A0A1E1MST3_RHYSE|nr:uncharacterized protein RSE6_13404 [Rhynchosporium secalis]